MKRNNNDSMTAVANGAARESRKAGSNGGTVVAAPADSGDLSVILASLQTMRDGDFSRAPARFLDRTGGENCRHVQFHCCCQSTDGTRN